MGRRPVALGLLASLGLLCALLPGADSATDYRYSPVAGRLSSQFGWRKDPMHGGSRFHSGIDIAAQAGTPVQVTQPGVVMYAGPYKGYGNIVWVYHGEQLYTMYAHLSRWVVQAGQTVQRGQVIAGVGSTGRSTGPHLHFEVHYKKQYLNPLRYLGALQTAEIAAHTASGARAQ
ncbi:MAG: M23 family metallopeptidase [Candidatus Melainabacteria bacterium]